MQAILIDGDGTTTYVAEMGETVDQQGAFEVYKLATPTDLIPLTHITWRDLPAGWMGIRGYAGSSWKTADAAEVARLVALDAERDDAAAAATAERAARVAEINGTLDAIPQAAKDELAALNADQRDRAAFANEGGDGYVPQAQWGGKWAQEIADRHGLDNEALGALLAELEAV